jgi:hypothetical protein
MRCETLANSQYFHFQLLCVFKDENEDCITSVFALILEIELVWSHSFEEGGNFTSGNTVEEPKHAVRLIIANQSGHDVHLGVEIIISLGIFRRDYYFFSNSFRTWIFPEEWHSLDLVWILIFSPVKLSHLQISI